MKEDVLSLKGKVIKALPNAIFDVELENGSTIKAHISGKIRQHNIRILQGDTVDCEVSVYDLNQGRIIYRYK